MRPILSSRAFEAQMSQQLLDRRKGATPNKLRWTLEAVRLLAAASETPGAQPAGDAARSPGAHAPRPGFRGHACPHAKLSVEVS